MPVIPPKAKVIAAKYAARLDPVWPDQSQPGVNAEDYWHQGIDDLVCSMLGAPRDPAITGSRAAIAAAGAPWGGSDNHEREERALAAIRDNNPQLFIDMIEQQEKAAGQFCVQELNARYMGRYHAYTVYAMYVVAKLRGWSDCIKWCRWWISRYKWLLEQGVVKGTFTLTPPGAAPFKLTNPVIWAGLRRVFNPDKRDSTAYDATQGKAPNVDRLPADANTRGGYPGSADNWMTAIAMALGLDLAALKPVKPQMIFDVEFVRRPRYVLSYFPLLKWRPGGGDIVVGAEFDADTMSYPFNCLVEQADQIPAPTWGYDPATRKAVPVTE